MEQMDMDLQGMFEKIIPKNTSPQEMTVKEAYDAYKNGTLKNFQGG